MPRSAIIISVKLTPIIDKPVFGQYACAGPSGAVLHVGDEVEVVDRVSRSVTPMMSPTPIAQNGGIPRIAIKEEGLISP